MERLSVARCDVLLVRSVSGFVPLLHVLSSGPDALDQYQFQATIHQKVPGDRNRENIEDGTAFYSSEAHNLLTMIPQLICVLVRAGISYRITELHLIFSYVEHERNSDPMGIPPVVESRLAWLLLRFNSQEVSKK